MGRVASPPKVEAVLGYRRIQEAWVQCCQSLFEEAEKSRPGSWQPQTRHAHMPRDSAVANILPLFMPVLTACLQRSCGGLRMRACCVPVKQGTQPACAELDGWLVVVCMGVRQTEGEHIEQVTGVLAGK